MSDFETFLEEAVIKQEIADQHDEYIAQFCLELEDAGYVFDVSDDDKAYEDYARLAEAALTIGMVGDIRQLEEEAVATKLAEELKIKLLANFHLDNVDSSWIEVGNKLLPGRHINPEEIEENAIQLFAVRIEAAEQSKQITETCLAEVINLLGDDVDTADPSDISEVITQYGIWCASNQAGINTPVGDLQDRIRVILIDRGTYNAMWAGFIEKLGASQQ